MQSLWKKGRLFAGLLSAVFLTSAAPSWAQTNLISNAGFETDTSPADGFPDGWQLNFLTPTTAQKAQWVQETAGIDSNHSTVAGEVRGIRVSSTWIDSGGTPSYIGKDPNLTRNPIQNLTVDQTYEFGVWGRGWLGDTVAGTFKGGATTMTITFYSSTGLIAGTSNYPNPVQVSNNITATTSKQTFGWTQFKGAAKVPPGTVRAALNFGLTNSSHGEIYFDDAFVQINPNAVTFDNGNLKVGGQPFLVKAMFMGGDKCRNYDGVVANPVANACPAGYIRDSQRIKNAGFNTVLSYPNGDSASNTTILAFLDRAKAEGLKVIFSLKNQVAAGDLAAAQALVQTFKDHDAIIGWYICDEFGEDKTGTGNILQNTYDMIKSEDASQDRPVISLLTHMTPNSAGTVINPALYVPSCDILAADPYPVGSNGRGRGESISMTGTWANKIRTAVDNYNATAPASSKRGTFMAPQAFAWAEAPFSGNSHDEVNPTLPEMRTMTYQSLVGGAQGFMYWSYEQIANEPHWDYGTDNIVDRLPQSTNLNDQAEIYGNKTYDTYIGYDGNPAPDPNTNRLMKALRTGQTAIDPDTGSAVPKTNLGRRMDDMTTLASEIGSLESVLNSISSNETITATTAVGKLKARAVTSGGNLYVFVTNPSNRAFTSSSTWTIPTAQTTSPARTVSVFKQDTGGTVTASLPTATSVTIGSVPAWGSFVLKVSPR